jgi:SAM-dependent methyltransferase
MSARSTAAGEVAGAEDARASRVVAWHDLECGRYSADLPLWHELAGSVDRGAGAAILDVGAGTGRVAIELARRGHRVTALERDAQLLEALAERAAGLDVTCILGDAREPPAEAGASFDLCVAAMQTVQLFGGASGRRRFLRAAHGLLRPGGLLACAIVTDVDPFDRDSGETPPPPELDRMGADLLSSRAVRVTVSARRIEIERERHVVRGSSPATIVDAEADLVRLDRVSAAGLLQEARDAGFAPAPPHEIAPTEEHVGSTVVMAHA